MCITCLDPFIQEICKFVVPQNVVTSENFQAYRLTEAYRKHGHKKATLDPLGLQQRWFVFSSYLKNVFLVPNFYLTQRLFLFVYMYNVYTRGFKVFLDLSSLYSLVQLSFKHYLSSQCFSCCQIMIISYSFSNSCNLLVVCSSNLRNLSGPNHLLLDVATCLTYLENDFIC